MRYITITMCVMENGTAVMVRTMNSTVCDGNWHSPDGKDVQYCYYVCDGECHCPDGKDVVTRTVLYVIVTGTVLKVKMRYSTMSMVEINTDLMVFVLLERKCLTINGDVSHINLEQVIYVQLYIFKMLLVSF